MPRRKKSDQPEQQAAEDRRNDLTDAERQTLALQWLRKFETSLAAKNKAASEHSGLVKKMKAEIGDDAVDLMKDMIAARTDEGEAALRAKMERAARAARYMAAPLGSQLEIFDEDRTPAVDRATAEGLRDGKLGVTAAPDYAPGTPQYDAYMGAWHDGQKSIMEFQRKQDGALFDQADAESEAEDGDGDGEDEDSADGAEEPVSLDPSFDDDDQGDDPQPAA